mgnify:FL=1
MDTFIGLGIVLKNDINITKELENFFDFLEIYVHQIHVNFPEEGDYEDWEEKILVDNYVQLIDLLAFRGAYASFDLEFNHEHFATRLSLSNEGDDLVVHLALHHPFEKRDIQSLELLTQGIASFIDTIDTYVVHDYIFCDNEAEYLYKKERMLELGYNPYAILKLHDRMLVQAAWYLDGFTERDLSQKH